MQALRGRLATTATLPDTAPALAQLMLALDGSAAPFDLQAVELGLAEVLSNLARHGTAGCAPGPVRIHWHADDVVIGVIVCDTGHPIPANRLEAAAGASLDFGDTDLGDLPEGGLGLPLVFRMFDRVDYRSRGGVNRLTLRRRLR